MPAIQIVERVGHIALRVPDLDAAVAFHSEVLGFTETVRVGGVSYLTCNDRHHELILSSRARANAGTSTSASRCPTSRRSSAPGRESPPREAS
jgi:catechol 2,3-dioxygenase